MKAVTDGALLAVPGHPSEDREQRVNSNIAFHFAGRNPATTPAVGEPTPNWNPATTPAVGEPTPNWEYVIQLILGCYLPRYLTKVVQAAAYVQGEKVAGM